jgi:DNA repair protein RecO (recombination protein O)
VLRYTHTNGHLLLLCFLIFSPFLMLIKTRGIVLSFLKYRETSIIARIYTERRGVQNYIVNGVRKAKPPGRIALFQPLTLLELVAYVPRQGSDLTRLSEFRCAEAFRTLPYEMRKSSVALFLSEVLSKSVREEEENEPLFRFLHDSILAFDEQSVGTENFALLFLLHLANYLGFGVLAGTAMGPGQGSGIATVRLREFEQYFDELLHTPAAVSIPNGQVRRELLTVLIRYYQLHVEGLGEVKSLDILSEVLGG